MHVGLHRKPRRGQDAFGRFHIGAVEPEPLGQFQPALDTALAADIAVVILDAVPPFDPCGAVAEPGDHHRVLERDRALVEIAVQRPGLHLSLVELSAMQQPVEWMQIVIARGADVAEHRFELIGVVEHDALADR
jgi:hypothetical protein